MKQILLLILSIISLSTSLAACRDAKGTLGPETVFEYEDENLSCRELKAIAESEDSFDCQSDYNLEFAKNWCSGQNHQQLSCGKHATYESEEFKFRGECVIDDETGRLKVVVYKTCYYSCSSTGPKSR